MSIKKTLTLNELLIVIILLGILALIAVTQYPRAVLNAKIAKAKHNISVIAGAEKIYHSETGEYERNLTNLSNNTGIDFSGIYSDTDWSYSVSGNFIIANRKSNTSQYISYNLNNGVFTEIGF